MSASREKKNRQVLSESGYIDHAAEQAKENAAKQTRSTRMYLIIIAAFLLLGVGLFAYNSAENSKVERENAEISATTAVTINGTDYTVGDMSYFYYSYYNNFINQNSAYLSLLGLDTTKSLHEQEYTEGKSWHELFLESALTSLISTAGAAAEAEASGFDAGEELDAEVEAALGIADYSASYYGYPNRAQYLKAVYGPYVTEEVYTRNVRMTSLASLYASDYVDTFTYTDAELQEVYDNTPKNFDSVSMKYVLFNAELPEEATEEETTAAAEEAKAKAEEILAYWARNFEAGAEELGGTYVATEYARYIANDDVAEWLFDDARTAGDRVVLAVDETSYAAIEFVSRQRNEYHPVTIRHILSEEQETAEKILKEFNNGEMTEEAFATLAMTNSIDSTTASIGGLIEGLYMGAADEAFEAWCYDSARKAGDVTVLETESGWHVIYFVETIDLPCWAAEAKAQLTSSDYDAWYAAFAEKANVERLDGMDLVGVA